MSIDGTWKLGFDTPIGRQETTLEVKAVRGALTGSQSGSDGSQPIHDGVVKGDEASWSLSVTSPVPITLEFNGKVDGDAMSGTVKLGMFGESTFTAARA